MPRDTIDRAVAKGSGADADASMFETVVYEGYGPSGVAVIVEALTDNRNRTASNVRATLSKNGGALGETNSVGFMFDTTLAITRMIFEGFFDQYPKLKVIASHGGGTLPYLVGRFEKGDEVELAVRRQMKKKPTDYLRHIYYDCINYDAGALRYLISVVGAERVMFGTDWPHWVHDTKGSFANTAALPKEQCEAVRSGNARRVFGL